jgi:inner membrane protein
MGRCVVRRERALYRRPRAQYLPMDSLSQLALGAAVGVAVLGRHTAVWKAACWGAVAGTLPDLDVLIDHGDPVRDMVLHRAESHALFWLTLFSLPFAAAVARLHGEQALWRRWWLALWLALVTHPLLDTLTIYGTQLALPFSDHPFGVGSVFVIDPLYTLPLLVGTLWALRTRGMGRGLAANAAGLVLSTAYLAWGVAAQWQVERVAQASLAAQGIVAERVLATPTPFNTLLWRVVAMSGDHFHEGFYSLLDDAPHIAFDRFERGAALAAELRALDSVQRIAAFSHGFYKLQQQGDLVLLSDLRMGQEPAYVFTFAVARRRSEPVPLAVPVQVGVRPDLRRGLAWLWRRALGQPLPPPR